MVRGQGRAPLPCGREASIASFSVHHPCIVIARTTDGPQDHMLLPSGNCTQRPGKSRFVTRHDICVAPDVYANEKIGPALSEFGFVYDEKQDMYSALALPKLDDLLNKPDAGIECERVTVEPPSD